MPPFMSSPSRLPLQETQVCAPEPCCERRQHQIGRAGRISGLLVQLGHTGAETPDGGHLVVLADAVTTPDHGDGEVCEPPGPLAWP